MKIGCEEANASDLDLNRAIMGQSQLPQSRSKELTSRFREQEIESARKSQEKRYRGDWVWEFVEGDGVQFDYGRDFLECGTQKLYHAYQADEFLPYYCYLDIVTERTPGWGFNRTQTLAQGYPRCDFRWKKGGSTRKGWPPPFAHTLRRSEEQK